MDLNFSVVGFISVNSGDLKQKRVVMPLFDAAYA